MAQTGHATDQVIPPESERGRRVLDKIFLERSANPEIGKIRPNLKVHFTNDSDLELASPLYLGDMSFGALSGVPNIAIARAAEITSVIAGTGEGGLLQEVANCSRITVQWASARFGVDYDNLSKGQAVIIKIGQGAKPGIGGHLPGVKVTEPISNTRRIPIGRDAISPAPHHDIYSIEDLGQRILALKEATRKPILVKVGATNFIPYIASGIARMGASGIIIDGAGAGTGAAPSVVKDNVGIPIELAVASVDSALRMEGLRDKFTVIAAGRVSTPEESLKLIALGADITSLGTAALISLGCIMVHKCHLGYCPAVLTNKIAPNQAKVLSVEQAVLWLSNLVRGWNEEMQILLEYVGLHDINDLKGRRDLLGCPASLNSETLEILGLHSKQNIASQKQDDFVSIEGKFNSRQLWTTRRLIMLREMSGTIGKSPGEAEISSMGTTAPPLIEEPTRISDFLVSDGAQVTRPSIDPYRERIETVTYFATARLRLSSPFFFTHLPSYVQSDVREIFAKVASSMGLLFDTRSAKSRYPSFNKYKDRIIAGYPDGVTPADEIISLSSEDYRSNPRFNEEIRDLKRKGKLLLLRCTSSIQDIDRIIQNEDLGAIFSGIILDEDEGNAPLEFSVSLLDKKLKQRNLRNRVSILSESNSVRGSDDIFKIIGLGADAVGFGEAALLAIGFEEGGGVVFDTIKSSERLENFVLALQKDIKLLAGAAGISSISSSLVGNRELLRSVDLDPAARKQLDVKPAGAP